MMTREDPILSNDDCGKRRRYIYIYTFIQRRTSIENHIYFCGQANRYKYINIYIVYSCDLIVVGSEGEIYIDTKSYIGSSI